jgi:hypothetical protein
MGRDVAEPPGRTLLARWCAHPVFLTFVLAGCMKALDLPAFAAGLSSWSLVPRRLALPLAFAIPAAELVTAGLWFLTPRRSTAVLACALLLIVFTAALLAQYLAAPPPSCNCTGRLRLFRESQQSALWSAARNLGMLVLLAPMIRATLVQREAAHAFS